MDISDHDLRALVRAAIARVTAPDDADGAARGPGRSEPDPIASLRLHASHRRLALSRGDDLDGACLIEPTVRCTHCGYCQSFGH